MEDLVEKFVEKHPRLYHMAEAESWPNIQQHGLLSVAALLDRFGIQGKRHCELYSRWRPDSVTIEHPSFGAASVRDQHCLRPEALERVLKDGLSPRDWYELLNGKCFLWVTEDRLNKMLNSPLYKDVIHEVLELDTRALVERDLEKIKVSPINSGFASRGKSMRGRDTFKNIQDYPLAGRKGKVAELTVEWKVPNIEEVALSVDRRKGGQYLGNIWKR